MNAIAPYGAERAEAYVCEPQPTDLVLLDTPYVTLVQLGQTKHADGGYTVELYATYDAEPLNDLGEPLPSLVGETMHICHMVDGMTMTSDACLLPNSAAYIPPEVSSGTAALFSEKVPIDVQSYPNASFYEHFEIALTGE